MKTDKITIGKLVRVTGGRIAVVTGEAKGIPARCQVSFAEGGEYPMLASQIKREATEEERARFVEASTREMETVDARGRAIDMEPDRLLAEYRVKLVNYSRAAATYRMAKAEMERLADELEPLALVVDARGLRDTEIDGIIAKHKGVFETQRHLEKT